MHSYISFDALVLGHDALLGRDRRGDSSMMQEIARQLGFKLNYVPPFQMNGISVSSSLIRKGIQAGDLDNAERMLGRRFSVLATVGTVSEQRLIIEDVSSLCLPPEGVYSVKVIGVVDREEVCSRAVLTKGFPYLELNFDGEAFFRSGQEIEVIF